MPADGKVGIDNPMPPETDPNLTINDLMTSLSDLNLHTEPVSSSASIGHQLSQA
jgi:hypothetical protein